MRGPVVYFAELAGASLVKIGYTRGDARSRVSQVRQESGISGRLSLFGTIRGGRAVEQKVHRVLARYRCTGEWFCLLPEVRRFIETCIEKNDVEIARAVHGDIIPDAMESLNHRLHEWQSYEERGVG